MRLTGNPLGPGDRASTQDLDDFDAGVAEGLDPQEETDRHRDTAVTHVSSPWNHRLCTVCGHSFRRGDRVRLGGGGTNDVTHLEPGLGCGVTSGTAGENSEKMNAADFASGVVAAWPPLDAVPVTRLGADAWQVARPAHGDRPPRCLYCGHTFRPGEHAVVCPCSPGRPHCAAAVHRDPVAGLICWESWRPEGRLTVCPVKLVPVRE